MNGDIAVEINGRPAPDFLAPFQRDGLILTSLIKEITVVDNNGTEKTVLLEGSSSSWQSFASQIVLLVVSLIFWIVGLYVFFRRPGNLVALLFCLAALSFGLAVCGNMGSSAGVPGAIFFEITASVIGPWLLLHFLLVLPEERILIRKKSFIALIYLPAALTLVFFFLIGFVNGQPVQWFRTLRFIEYGFAFAAIVGIAVWNHVQARLQNTRQQMKIISISFIAALVPFLVLYLIPHLVRGNGALPPEFALLTVVFIPFGMGYAVITRKLLDIDVFIKRSAVYSIVTFIMTIILSAAIFLCTMNVNLRLFEKLLLALIIGAVATALFGPVKRYIDVSLDKLFFRDRYDYRQIINSLGISLNSTTNLSDFARLIVGTVVHTLNLAGGCLFIKSQGLFEVYAAEGYYADTQAQSNLFELLERRNPALEFPNYVTDGAIGVAFLVPLRIGEKEVGILFLSAKNSRQKYSPDDLYLVQGLASIAAMALHSTLLIRDVNTRDTFVSIASHELRTPLTSILGYTDLLLRRNPPDEVRERWLANILEGGKRIAGMVDDMLNVTRIHSGKLAMRFESIRLPEVVSECLKMFRESTASHEFLVNMEKDLPEVLVDRDKFGQVISNLLSNAIKYSPGGGLVEVTAVYDPQESRVILNVIDQGIGISPEDQTSLFHTFHRVQRPETVSIKGSGLGLYIAKEWMEAMRGEIWLRSELDKGSTFSLGIPVAEKDNN